MQICYTPEQEQLREQLREYFAALMTPERRDGLARTDGDYGDGEAYKEVVRQLGRDGWLAIGWPAEYGGQARLAGPEIATAKFWAADGGHRVAHTAGHIHGGVGIDTDGDTHRYLVAAKHHEFAPGGATAQLRQIGAALAAS